MEPHVYIFILFTLVIVILLHLAYNDKRTKTSKKSTEKMCSASTDDKPLRVYDDGKYRDKGTSGLDRTHKSKRWYHVVNKLVANDKHEKEMDQVSNGSDHSRHSGRRVKHRLFFDGNYEGVLVSNTNEAEHVESKFVDDPADVYTDVFGDVCNSRKNREDAKEYIRNVVLDGRTQCGCVTDKSKSDFTREEIDEYREKQLHFRDKVYGTSAPVEDPVDKMNQITMAGGIHATGQTIADVYDKLVSNENDKANTSIQNQMNKENPFIYDTHNVNTNDEITAAYPIQRT